MKKVKILIYILIIFSSCTKKKSDVRKEISVTTSDIYIAQYQNEEFKNNLKNKILKGDTLAYNNLKEIYYLTGNKKDFLYYSIMMADKYKYKNAYKDCYYLLKNNDSRKNNFNNMLADYYLVFGYEMDRNYFELIIKERFINNEKIPQSKNILFNNH